jgi:hypothetical protein|tara:strand:+ start:284 stop:532 length:249 start_codon:yes stop_codon:yes gene_type:complete
MNDKVKSFAILFSITLGLFLGFNESGNAQSGWFPCGRCDYDSASEYLGPKGFCSYTVAGVVNGCSANDGDRCSNGECSKLRM